MKEARLRVIDVETSGGEPSEVIEIGAVDVVPSDEGWRAEPPRSTLFRPVGAISCHAMAVHHLTREHFAEDAPIATPEALRAFVLAGPRPDALVAHNARFEARYVGPEVTADCLWICTVRSARHAWPDAPGYGNQVLRYWRGLRLNPALAMPPHRAAPDAWVTAHILMELLQSANWRDLLAWSAAPHELTRVPFGRHRGKPWAEVPASYLQWLVAEPDMADEVVRHAGRELSARGG